jgi:hypothetical protein
MRENFFLFSLYFGVLGRIGWRTLAASINERFLYFVWEVAIGAA